MTTELQSPIKCRARKSARCHDGKQLPTKLDPWEDDGTWEAASGTIVCDPCYVALGQPLNPVLPTTPGPRAGWWPGRDDD